MKETVLLMGASNKTSRYSNMAMNMLIENGHRVIPVHPREKIETPEGTKKSLAEVTEIIDTVSVYVRPSILENQMEDLLRINPKRIIFNPGTEAPDLVPALETHGIRVQMACTLVLLKTNQF